MRRPIYPVLTSLVLLATTACKKDPPSAAQPVTPDNQDNGPPVIKKEPTAPIKEVAVDLSPYAIRGEIMLPEGSKIRRRMAYGTCFIDGGPGFTIDVEKAAIPVDATKNHWNSLGARWVKDEPNALLAELKGIAAGTYAFEARVKLGDDTYRLHCNPAMPFTQEQVELMLRCAQSLKQTDAIKESVKREPEAIAALKMAGCKLSEGATGGRRLQITGDTVTDKDLAGVKDIAGISSIWFQPSATLTREGVTHLSTMRGIDHLTVRGPQINDKLVTPLKAMSDVRALTIESTSLTDAGLSFVAGMPNLEEFTLIIDKHAGSKMNGAGLTYFKGLKKIKSLRLAGESIDDVAMDNIAPLKSLRMLQLERARITDGGLRHLDGLKELEELNLIGVPVRGSGVAIASSLPKLKTLRLDACAVTDSVITQLRASSVNDLSLLNTAVGDYGLKAIVDLSSLKKLNLSGTKVTDAGLAHLANVKGLTTLDLTNTNVTGAGLANLKANAELEALILHDSSVTDDGLKSVVEIPNLRQLNLGETAITDTGIGNLHAAQNLRSVVLEGSDATKAGVDQLKQAIKRINVEWTEPADIPDPKPVLPPVAIDKLSPADPAALVKKYGGQIKVDDNEKDKPVIAVSLQGSAVTDEELAHLRAWKSLRSLNLSGCAKVTDAALPYIGLLTYLTKLHLGGTAIKGDGLVHLKGIVELATLELPTTLMTVKQVAPLSSLTELEQLRVTLPDGSESLRFFGNFRKLKDVDLRKMTMSNRKMAILARVIGLERLDIDSDRVGDRGLAALKDLTKLEVLRLKNSSATDDGLKAIGAMTGLRVLEISGPRFTDNGFLHLRNLADLERLKLERTGLTDRGLQYIRECSKLIELELRGAAITDKGLTYLADMKFIEWIDLSNTKVTDAGLKQFKDWEELRRLTIENTAITGIGFAHLAKSPRLWRIQMARSRANDEGLTAISNIEVLEQFDLSDTDVTDQGLERLKALPFLKSLILDGVNGITDKAVEIVKEYPYLGEISLRQTGLSAEAISELKKKEGLMVVTE